MTEPQDQGARQQVIAGEQLRVAGRDYFEAGPGSLKVLLATASAQELDELALDNERMFHLRFDMDLPRPAREQVLQLKRRHGYTDDEIRVLRKSGHLRVTRTEAALDRSPWMALMGGFYGTSLTLFVLAELAIVQLSIAPAWKQALATSVLFALWGGLGWGVTQLFWKPARLFRASLPS